MSVSLSRPVLSRRTLPLLLLVPLLLAAGCSKGPKVRIEVLHEGDGPRVEAGDFITADYTLTLEDGTKIESSRPEEGGEGLYKVIIGAGNVIKGWDQAIPKMKVGERARLTIPPELGYGDRVRPGSPIPPNATLVFDLEILEAQKGPHVEMGRGLAYDIVKEGKGKVVQMRDTITAHYRLYLPDGTLVQSSRQEEGGGGAMTRQIGVGGLIPGWDRTIPGMREGEVRKLYVPSMFAYGEQGMGDVIRPNTDLTFEIELLKTVTTPR